MWLSKWSGSVVSNSDPMDCSPPGSSVHGIFQARVLEWGAIAFSIRSSPPRDQTWVSHVVGRHFTIRATREVSYVTKTKQCRKNGLFFSPPWKPWIPSSLRAPDSLSTYLRISSLTSLSLFLWFPNTRQTFFYLLYIWRASLVAQKVKHLPAL